MLLNQKGAYCEPNEHEGEVIPERGHASMFVYTKLFMCLQGHFEDCAVQTLTISLKCTQVESILEVCTNLEGCGYLQITSSRIQPARLSVFKHNYIIAFLALVPHHVTPALLAATPTAF